MQAPGVDLVQSNKEMCSFLQGICQNQDIKNQMFTKQVCTYPQPKGGSRICFADPVEETSPKAVKGSASQIRQKKMFRNTLKKYENQVCSWVSRSRSRACLLVLKKALQIKKEMASLNKPARKCVMRSLGNSNCPYQYLCQRTHRPRPPAPIL